jgi:sugar phosphate isomerase/epimerase
MKLAFSTLGCPGWSLERVVAAAGEYGYEGVELRLLDGEVIPPTLAASERRRVRDAFAGAGVEIACLDTSARFTAREPEARRAQEDDVRRYLEMANELGTPLIRVFGGNLTDGVSEEQGVEFLRESLNRLAADAERHGVTVALETHDAFSAGRLVAAVLDRVQSSRIAALWDTHHPYRMGETAAQTWEFIGPRMVHAHVKDARRTADGGWQLVLLGQGEVPVREALRTWAAHGYNGYVCVEWEKKWHPEIEEPEIALPQHAEVLRRYFAEISVIPNDTPAGKGSG